MAFFIVTFDQTLSCLDHLTQPHLRKINIYLGEPIYRYSAISFSNSIPTRPQTCRPCERSSHYRVVERSQQALLWAYIGSIRYLSYADRSERGVLYPLCCGSSTNNRETYLRGVRTTNEGGSVGNSSVGADRGGWN